MERDLSYATGFTVAKDLLDLMSYKDIGELTPERKDFSVLNVRRNLCDPTI